MIAVHGDAAEVALGEAQAVLAMVQDEERRGRLADLVAAVQEGELGDDEAQALEELIELGLSTRPHPQRLRARGRAGRAEDVSPAARRPRALGEREGGQLGARRARGQRAREREGAVGRSRRVRRLGRGRRARAERQARSRGRAHPLRRRLMADGQHYFACLDLNGRDCLVVGGGNVGHEKVVGPARRGRARHRRRAGDLRRGRRAAGRAAAPRVPRLRSRRTPARDRRDVRRRGQPARVRRRRGAQSLLQRRRRPGALLVHPAGRAPARADRRRRLDGRRVACARSGAPRPVRVAGRRRARVARVRAAQPASVGEGEPPRPTRSAATTSASRVTEALG